MTTRDPRILVNNGLADESPFAQPRPGSAWARMGVQLTDDPEDVAQSLFMVQTKDGRAIPYSPLTTQRAMEQHLGLRNFLVKPRQIGSTTKYRLDGLAACITTPNVNMLLLTNDDDNTAAQLEAIRWQLKHLNDPIRDGGLNMGLKVAPNNADHIGFPQLGSHIYVGTANAPAAGRSKTIHIAILTEVAYWMKTVQGVTPEKSFKGITESVPLDGFVMAESTPNGPSGFFFDGYREEGNSFIKHFYPWFIEPSRAIALPDGYQLLLTPDEVALVAQHGLTQEQIAWRRWKMADIGADFLQEYPEDDATCWLAGQKLAFHSMQIGDMLREAKAATPDVMVMAGEPWEEGGTLTIWVPPQKGARYLLACDVGGGHKNGDYSTGIIRDADTGIHVASLRGHWSPTSFGRVTVTTAKIYNGAYLSIERNGIGNEAAEQAAYREGYLNMHWSTPSQATAPRGLGLPAPSQAPKPGYYINPSERSNLIGMVKAEVDHHQFASLDEELLNQILSVKIATRGTPPREVYEVAQNVHDDKLMAYAQSAKLLADHVLGPKTRPAPVPMHTGVRPVNAATR